MSNTFGNVIGFIVLVGIAYTCHRYWRSKAISCASSWLAEQGLEVSNWATADFVMHRQNPSIAFTAADTSQSEKMFDVKLRFKMGLWGDWSVDEIAYRCPLFESE